MSKVALIVDDSMVVRRMLRHSLSKLGFETLEAEDGVAALAVARGKTLALIVTDYHMPRMNGLEFIIELRASGGHETTPVVFLTTEIDPVLRDEASTAGATVWVTKPFPHETMASIVQKIAA